MSVEFEEASTPVRTFESQKPSFMMRMVIQTGLAKTASDARLVLIGIALACIALAIAFPFIVGAV